MAASWVAVCLRLVLFYYITKGEAKCPEKVATWRLDGSEQEVIMKGGASYKYEDGVTALYLNGNGSYADVPAVKLPVPTFSITCWVKVLEPAKTPGYVFADWSSPHQFALHVPGDSKVVFFQLRNKTGAELLATHTSSSIRYNVWLHLTATWDSAKRIGKIFIDDTLEARKVIDSAMSSYEVMNNSHSYYQIGSKNDSGETFHGFIRNIKVFKTVLSSSEISMVASGINDEVGPPVVNISGVTVAFKGRGKVILDGSKSYDKHPNCGDSLYFTWFCRRSHETFPENDSLPVIDIAIESHIASGGCYGYGPGRFSVQDNVLALDIDKMEASQTYAIELLVSNGVKSSKAIHWITVEKQFFISCIYNCGPEVIPSKRMIIESNCIGELCERITRYHWSMFKMTPADTWVEIEDLAQRILTDLDNPSLVLTGKLDEKEYSLEMNTTYKINGSITLEGGIVHADDIKFRTVAPLSVPMKGCNVQPDEGVVFMTNFTVDCSGWLKENANLSYDFSYITSTGTVIVKSTTYIPYIQTLLPQGKISDDYNVTIKVDIFGQKGSSYVEMLTVKVKPLQPGTNDSTIMEILTSEISGFLNEGSVSDAANLAIAILSTYDSNVVKYSTLRAMAGAKVSQISEVTQLTAVVVMATEDRTSIPIVSLEDASTLLTTTTNYLRTHAQEDRDVVEEIGGNILQGISNTLSPSADLADEHYRKFSEQDGTGDTQRVRRMLLAKKDDDRGFVKAKNVTERILSVADTLGTTLLSIKMPGERKSTVKSNVITMTIERKQPLKIGSETFSGDNEEGAVTFPSTEVLFGKNGTDLPSVDSQMLTLKVNPYVWTNNSVNIKSSVLSLDLKKQDGSLLNISGLTNPIELFIPEEDQEEDFRNDTRGHLFVKPYNDSSAIRYHKIEIANEFESAFVEIRPENGSRLDIFVGSGFKPTPDNYTFVTKIPDFSSCKNKSKIGYSNCTSSPCVFSVSSNVTGNIGVHFIGIRLASDVDAGTASPTNRKRTVRSCMDSLGRQKRSCIGVKDPPTTPPPTPKFIVPRYDKRTDVNYTMSVKVRSCLFWSEKKQTWTNDGCRIGWKTGKGKLHCLCTHLSAFGGSIFVAPNPIDFDKVFTEFTRLGETGNYVVLSTVCLIFGMYFIGLLLARRADKKDLAKVVANVHLTNSQMEGYAYDISIQTGMWKGFGTSAHVGITVNGENGSSGEISLAAPLNGRKYFSRGSVNIFTLTLPSSLGKLTDIRIWHDNTGSNPAWFLQQVVIADKQTGDMWYFFANQWLTLDERSGSIELSIEAAKDHQLAAFKPLFYARAAGNLGEGHLWISVFTRPPHNPFTRCQRLTCCLSFLFAAMVTNAMFYQFDRTPTDTFKFGPLVVSWTQIKIGIQSSVIAIPANLLVVLIFRNAKQAASEDIYDPRQNTNKPKSPGCLPHFFVYVAWCLSLLFAFTGATFTVFYSLVWGADISNEWLTSILVSLVQDILITQPIKVLALATLLSLLIRKPPELDPVIGATWSKSEVTEVVVSKPPKEEELAKERDTRSKDWKMLEAMKEALSFVIFGFLLMVVCYGNLHPARYQFTKSTRNIFSARFEKVVDTPSLWKWIDKFLVPGLYDVTWYNGQPFEYKEGFISNKQTFLMGMPRLRQLRINKKKRCQTDLRDTRLNDLFPECLETSSSGSEDNTPYNLPKWIPLDNYSHFASIYDICPKPWRYQSGTEMNTLSHQAVRRSYGGGGYVADLGYSKESALEVIRDLRDNDWVDTSTAAVFIEFTLFDSSTSLFCSVRHVFERLPTGGTVTGVAVRALTLYPSANAHLQSFYEVCQLLFLVVIVAWLTAEIVKYFRVKGYFRHAWNWLELLLLVCSFLAVVMSLLKAKHTSLYVKEVQSNPYETFSSDYIVRWLDQETLWLSLAIFILTLKLLRLIRFNHHICQMQGTLKRSAQPILSFTLVLATIVVAFTQFGFLCFGSNLAAFSTFFASLRAILLMAVGKQIGNVELYHFYPVLGSLFLFFYLCVMLFIMVNVFVAIFVDAYGEVREDQAEEFSDAELGTFMYNVLIKKIKELPGKVITRIKQSSNVSHDTMSNAVSRNLSGTTNDLSGIDFAMFEPAQNNTIPPACLTIQGATATDINERMKEIDLLAEMKIRFMEIAAELDFLHSHVEVAPPNGIIAKL